MAFVSRPEGSEGTSYTGMGEEHVYRGNSKCECPKGRAHMEYLRNSKSDVCLEQEVVSSMVREVMGRHHVKLVGT